MFKCHLCFFKSSFPKVSIKSIVFPVNRYEKSHKFPSISPINCWYRLPQRPAKYAAASRLATRRRRCVRVSCDASKSWRWGSWETASQDLQLERLG